MTRIRRVLSSAVVAFLLVSGANAADNFCMDCISNTIVHEEPNRIWIESDAMCCMAPCAGYDAYEVEQPDRGYGCLTKEVKSDVIVGDVCDSNENDLNCPESQPSQEPQVTNPASPIILDLGDDTYRLTSVWDGVQFDLRNDGVACQIAWTRLGAENAFLALDRNGNGRIDNGAELFGNFTPLQSGQLASHGFEALAELDANGDGVLDANDSAWATLLLWTDRNHDGASTPDELQSLASSAVTTLELDPALLGRRDQWGNQFRYMAHFRFRQPATETRRTYYDVFFRMAE